MNRCSRRTLGATACALLLTGSAGAQPDILPEPDPCTPSVPGLTLITISNEELSQLEGLLDFEPQLLDEEGNIVQEGTFCCRMESPNLSVANILSRLDIDGDDFADNSPDTDGDGLPDNWELGGIETGDRIEDRVVFYPAPLPIVPGTPPTPIFTRRAVATSALQADTDGDGLSDFIEVFGLMFIDDNRNGALDTEEWVDRNSDGLPSPGEYPVDQSFDITDVDGVLLRHDFDGFVFTDPTNPDTDGDGIPDGKDTDPLINPRAFGIGDTIIVRFDVEDIDLDGLGNGMDMGNDLLPTEASGFASYQVIDNPANLRELLDLFREDLLGEGIVPESAIEDLLGSDWDGNGLWRTTDVREWSLVIDPDHLATRPPDELFLLDDGTPLYARQDLGDLMALYNESVSYDRYGSRQIGLGWQEVLRPSSTDQFIPDRRVWAILYSWRMPGFDIDGDGFIGVPNITATAAGPEPGTAMVALHRTSATGTFHLSDEVPLVASDSDEQSYDLLNQPFDDRISIGEPEPEEPKLNGIIEVDSLRRALGSIGCGAMGVGMLGATALGLLLPMWWRRR